MQWDTPERPAEAAENRLIQAILDSQFPIDSTLPGERELSAMLGVTRPTLREALQRLARDGWIEIHQGKPTRVRDYWREGSLGVLGSIALNPQHLPAGFVGQLLEVRLAMAPAYTRAAVDNAGPELASFLDAYERLEDDPQAYTCADWELHHRLTQLSGNPIYTLILNGFRTIYFLAGPLYFERSGARAHSRRFYSELAAVAQHSDAEVAGALAQRVMRESLERWKETKKR